MGTYGGMDMMEQIQALRAALGDVPSVLLTPEAQRVLDGVRSSLDVIERSEADKPVVLLVGPTGAGKSHVFNMIVGGAASPEGVLRPTTSSFVVAGIPPPRIVHTIPDAVAVDTDGLPFFLVDTPGSDDGSLQPDALIDAADLVVVVVSPIRYADATVGALWDSLDTSRAILVLNRVADAHAAGEDLVRSVAGRFGVEPYVLHDAAEADGTILDHIARAIPPTRIDAMVPIMAKSAGAGARYVVREATNAAPEIGKVAATLATMPDCMIDISHYDLQMSWDGTREGIVDNTVAYIHDRDEDVVRGSGTSLAERIREIIGPWEAEALVSDLDTWSERNRDRFTEAASVRWRRSNADQLIERFSWSTVIDPQMIVPKRFTRIMGQRLADTITAARADLIRTVCSHVDARSALWHAVLDTLGSYRPGVLAAAADTFERELVGNG